MTEQADYAELAREIKLLIGPKRGFALLMRLDDGHFHYAASARREDVRKTLVEWLARVGVVNVRDQGETLKAASERLTLEGRCALLGRILEAQGYELTLFLFDFGERGNLAWYSNVPDPRAVVQSFLDVTGGEQ